MLEKVVNRVYITSSLYVLVMVVIMSTSSCSTGHQVSSCPGLAVNDCKNYNEIN